ncbi:Cellulosome-anchoring protein precursor [compost metagenome]
MIGNAMKEKPRGSGKGPGPFTDVSVNHWAAPMLSQMKSRGYLKGYSNGSFKPDASASRAEFTTILYEILVK